MASVLVPVAYLVIIFGGLFVFSFFYRKHTSRELTQHGFIPNADRGLRKSL